MITRFPSTKKQLLLTFDDGPGKYTSGILDHLQEHKVPALFFWNTRTLYAKRPWSRLFQEGHLLGSHSHTHANLAEMTYEQQLRQMKISVQQLKNITGKKPRLFRPPYGSYNKLTIEAADHLGLQTVLWNISSLDWELKKDPERIADNVVNHLQPGSVVLLHELPQTLQILPVLLDRIKQEGYQPVLPSKVIYS